MNNNKLLAMLKSFTPKELRGFDQYLNSDVFNADEKVNGLFYYLKDNLNGLEGGVGEKEKVIIFNKFFPKQKYNDKKVRYLFTDLTRCTENYLTYQALEKDEPMQMDLLSRELAQRNCEKAYNSIYSKSRTLALDSKIKNADFYFHQYSIQLNHLNNVISKQKRNEKSNIEAVVENLDKFYLAKKLQLCCEIYNAQNVLSANYRVFLLEEILIHLRSHSYQDTPVIGVYFQILLTLTDPEKEENFLKLRSLLLEHESFLSLLELREGYQYALNYCIKKINLGNINFQKTLFEIYKITLANKVILTNNSISQWEYKNIVTISLRLKEYPWAKDFINEFKNYLLAGERENAFTYNMAYWHFYKKEYSKSLNLLQKVNFTDIYYQLDTRAIILKIYYELNDLDAFFYHEAAFKTFLKRNKTVSDYQRIIYKNFIKYSAKILRVSSSKSKIAALKNEIQQIKQLADIQWLLQKVEELI